MTCWRQLRQLKTKCCHQPGVLRGALSRRVPKSISARKAQSLAGGGTLAASWRRSARNLKENGSVAAKAHRKQWRLRRPVRKKENAETSLAKLNSDDAQCGLVSRVSGGMHGAA